MATTFADLEARVRGAESRLARTEEDITAIISTVVEIRDEVAFLKRHAVRSTLALDKIMSHLTLEAPTSVEVDEALGLHEDD